MNKKEKLEEATIFALQGKLVEEDNSSSILSSLKLNSRQNKKYTDLLSKYNLDINSDRSKLIKLAIKNGYNDSFLEKLASYELGVDIKDLINYINKGKTFKEIVTDD